jgi:hypothetical protein
MNEEVVEEETESKKVTKHIFSGFKGSSVLITDCIKG